MAGHSKWHNIKHKKAASDAKRGKIFTKHARMITIAAKQGGDINMNPLLKAAVDAAKVDNVPNENIDRAIKKGTGELKDDTIIEELFYDAFGPAGSVLFIEVLTDNKNRSLTNIKKILNKKGGRFADSGSVAWMFKKRGLINAKCLAEEKEDLEIISIEAGADEIVFEDDIVNIFTIPEDLMHVKSELEAQGVKINTVEIVYDAKENRVSISRDSEAYESFETLMEALDEDEDVSNIYTNVDVED
ncbi:YebC/PmpR family DNA-binding transcriptional regulator [Candidatus Peregrinibacteria bacterium]|nr:YebC/PmpR family DNA-binding transcriptional regulator [Candidatus Peregrinibacteria bacterium]